jgi:hypothetical protein
LVAYLLFRVLGRGVAEIVSGLSDTPLGRLAEQVAGVCNPGPPSSQPDVPSGPGLLRDVLALPFGKAVLNRKARHAYEGPRCLPVGDTTLRAYYGRDPALSIVSWAQEVEEAFVVARLLEQARAGDPDAAEALFLRYAHEIRPAIRHLTESEEDAQKIELGVRGRIIADIVGLDPRVQSVLDFAKGCVYPAFQAHFGLREQSYPSYLPPATFDDETQDEALDRLHREALRRGHLLVSAPPPGPDAGLLQALKTEREVMVLWATLSGVNLPHHATVVLIGTVFRRMKRKARGSVASDAGRAESGAERIAREKARYWEAKQIVRRISHVPLRDLAHFFMEKYLKQSHYPEPVLRPCFAPYMGQMDAPVASFLKHEKTANTYSGPKDALVGDTQLRFYFTDDPEDNIAKWRYSAKRRTMGLIFDSELGHLFER